MSDQRVRRLRRREQSGDAEVQRASLRERLRQAESCLACQGQRTSLCPACGGLTLPRRIACLADLGSELCRSLSEPRREAPRGFKDWGARIARSGGWWVAVRAASAAARLALPPWEARWVCQRCEGRGVARRRSHMSRRVRCPDCEGLGTDRRLRRALSAVEAWLAEPTPERRQACEPEVVLQSVMADALPRHLLATVRDGWSRYARDPDPVVLTLRRAAQIVRQADGHETDGKQLVRARVMQVLTGWALG